ncbi:MAG: tetraacyldisaccharide 4'-kinase [bacterium]|nr:tetraacyldisaccharide 4'-kinase [bacterium]
MNILENKVVSFLMLPLSWLYHGIIQFRNWLFNHRLLVTHRVEQLKIISIGNITTGGTGKTPFCIFLAKLLTKKKNKVVILSRGYGRKSSGTLLVSDQQSILVQPDAAGDEPFLLARALPGVPVIVETDRYRSAQYAKQLFSPDVIILDDAFQHRRLHRDLNIVLVDATTGFGNRRLLPAGHLREPISNLKRADMVCLTRFSPEQLHHSILNKDFFLSKGTLKCQHIPEKLIRFSDGKSFECSLLADKKTLLFSGIANPLSFEKMVAKLGAKVCQHITFADHHRYTKNELDKIVTISHNGAVELIVTTEKDAVRIHDFAQNLPNLFYLSIEIKIIDGMELLQNKLNSLLQN